MADVASFNFYEDPVARTNATSCTVNFTAQTITLPGVAGYPFDKVDELVKVIRDLASQDLSDGVAETGKNIYKADGTLLLAVTAAVVGPPPAVTTLSIGTVFVKAKALDLANGLDAFVLMVP